MARKRTQERRGGKPLDTSCEILRSIGALNPYAGADASEVEERLRKMNYGATNSRISKLRRAQSAQPADL